MIGKEVKLGNNLVDIIQRQNELFISQLLKLRKLKHSDFYDKSEIEHILETYNVSTETKNFSTIKSKKLTKSDTLKLSTECSPRKSIMESIVSSPKVERITFKNPDKVTSSETDLNIYTKNSSKISSILSEKESMLFPISKFNSKSSSVISHKKE